MDEIIKYRSALYPGTAKPFSILSEYAYKSYIFFLSFWIAIMYVLLARHLQILWFGIGGLFATVIMSNIAGAINAKANFVEIGFNGGFFYIASVYDIAFQSEIEYYPLAFANISNEGGSLYVNYKGRMIRLKKEEWTNWQELYFAFEMSHDN
jgi:hypothetical protein